MRTGKQTARFIIALVLAVAAGTRGAEYKIDPDHSEILFKVRHLGIHTVTGRFEKFTGSFDVDPKNVKTTKGSAVIEAASINTNSPKRDEHLRSEPFFQVEKNPLIKFESKAVRDVNIKDSTCTLVGDLTIRGVTREIALKVKGEGLIDDGMGNERAAFHASGSLNRFDYGVSWNKAVGAGRFVVAEKVDIIMAFEGVRKIN